MKTAKPWSLQVLWATVLLASASGCVDFDQERSRFCQRNPDRCDQAETKPPSDGGRAATTAPIIIGSSQSAPGVLVQGSVTLSVTAQDAETPQLGFSWTANIGTVGVATNTGTTSEVIWTSPSCVPEGSVVSVTVTVTNGGPASVSKAFTLSANACPAPAVAAGVGHTVALRGDGTVWAWGDNSSGQLGDGTYTQRDVPVQVPGLTSVTALAAGRNHTVALRSDGTVWAWGSNSSGQLGNGTTSERLTPTRVPGLTSVTALAAVDNHTVALRSDGNGSAEV